jgi:hypothetical protein
LRLGRRKILPSDFARGRVKNRGLRVAPARSRLCQVLLVAVDRNGGAAGRADNVVWIGRQCENGRLVGFGDRVVDGPERDRDGGRADR